MRIFLRPCGTLLLAVLPLPLIAVMPLREQWQAACRSFAQGNPVNALAAFRTFDQWYGNEPEIADPVFNEIRIRLWGLAAMQAGELEEAARLLERWFIENPESERFRAFLRFQLAGIYQNLGDRENTARHRRAFLESHPDLPESALIRWVMADEAFAEKDFATARDQLLQVREAAHLPPSGRSLAAAALALVELADGNAGAALGYLRSETEETGALILDCWRSLVAPVLTRRLLDEDDPERAAFVSGWFDRLPDIGARLTRFQQALDRPLPGRGRQGPSVRSSIWNAHWRGQLGKLSHSLKKSDDSLNQPEKLYRLRLRTLLRSKRHGASTILGRALFQSGESVSATLRTSACKAAIEGYMNLRQWDRAEDLAHSFLERFPEDPDLPDILLLQARSSAGRGQWKTALDLVDRLLASWPEHPSRHSWRLYQAGWLLDMGLPGEARQAFADLAQSSIPETWKPFITFQMARCLEALRHVDEAAEHYRAVTGISAAAAMLRESAWSGLLKIHLRQGADAAFHKDLAGYRKRFPEGTLQDTMTNLEGSNHRLHGRHEAAVAAFGKVASGTSAANGFAREQLSLLFREARDPVALQRHALAWISARSSLSGTLSATPFEDCRLYQRETGKAALPTGLLQALLEDLDHAPARLPATPFLSLLGDSWPVYRNRAGLEEGSVLEFAEGRAETAFREGRTGTAAACLLFAAHLLAAHGRDDSADTRRIRVLHSADTGSLGREALIEVAETAARYDFPEATPLLEAFLERFPQAPGRPRALLSLARIRWENDRGGEARSLLQQVFRHWPDALEYAPAALLLSHWQIEEGLPDRALAVLDTLLQSASLAAIQTAEALLLRTRADFQVGNPDRAFLTGIRLLALYPDIHEVAEPARRLLGEKIAALPDPGERARLQQRFDALLQENDSSSPPA